MAYEMVGMCLAENLRNLDVALHTPENRALWNLSNALLNMCMAMEQDLLAIRQDIAVLRQQIAQR